MLVLSRARGPCITRLPCTEVRALNGVFITSLARFVAGQHVLETTASATKVTYQGSADKYDLVLSQVGSNGVPTATWIFTGSTDERTGNQFVSSHGIHKFPDGVHLALTINMKGNLTIPGENGDIVLKNPQGVSESIGVAVKFNTNTGKAAWAKMISASSERGGTIGAVDGDSTGDMIVRGSTCITGTQATTRDCTYFVSKLSSADGSEVWKTNIPTGVSINAIRMATDGSGYISGKLTGSVTIGGDSYASPTKDDGTHESSPILIKITSAGAFSWAKTVGLGSGEDLDLSHDNSVLVLMCSSGAESTVDGKTFGAKTFGALSTYVVRLATTDGQVIWAMDMPYLRGVEVTPDNNHVVVFGLLTNGLQSYTLTDAEGESTTLKSRGSYDLFVAKMKASDGTGVWAIDGGGDDMEYFHGFGMDGTGNILVGGYSRSTDFAFGIRCIGKAVRCIRVYRTLYCVPTSVVRSASHSSSMRALRPAPASRAPRSS